MANEANEDILEAVNAPKIPPEFELIVGGDHGEITNGDVPVRWCVTPELIKRMEDDNIVDPHVLLITATLKAEEMQRQLIPLTELKTYVRFHKAGKQKLYGFIINGKNGRKFLHNAYLRKFNGSYRTDIFCIWDTTVYNNLPQEFARTELTLEIPANVFGKEPSPWMKWFVNLWHSSNRTVDECHYRERAILAFSIKWIFVLAWAILSITARITAVVVFSLAGFFKQVNWKCIFRPYKYNSMKYHVFDEIEIPNNSFVLRWKFKPTGSNIKKTIYMFSSFLINPLILILFGGIYYYAPDRLQHILNILGIALSSICVFIDLVVFAVIKLDERGSLKKIFGFFEKMAQLISGISSKLVIGFVTTIMLLSVFFVAHKYDLITQLFLPSLIFSVLIYVFFKYGSSLLDRFENFISVSPEKNDYTEIRELLCPRDTLNLSTKTEFIPPKQRTIRLWVKDMKNKVCKPMQR